MKAFSETTASRLSDIGSTIGLVKIEAEAITRSLGEEVISNIAAAVVSASLEQVSSLDGQNQARLERNAISEAVEKKAKECADLVKQKSAEDARVPPYEKRERQFLAKFGPVIVIAGALLLASVPFLLIQSRIHDLQAQLLPNDQEAQAKLHLLQSLQLMWDAFIITLVGAPFFLAYLWSQSVKSWPDGWYLYFPNIKKANALEELPV